MPHARVNGLDLFYRDSGPRNGPTVLFISGLGNDHRAFAAQARALSEPAMGPERSYRCITYDQRDVGQSSLAAAPYTIADLADDAAGLLAALDVPMAHVVGWSMGGAVAQELALRHPERVRSLALLATYTSSDPRGAARQRSWALLRERLAPQEYADATWPWVYTVHDYHTPGLMEEALRRVLENPTPQPNEAYWRQVEAVLGHHTEGRLSAIAAPTLLVFGEEDLLTPMRFARVLAAEVPHARLVTIPRAGHALLWTHAELVTMLLRGWLEEVAG